MIRWLPVEAAFSQHGAHVPGGHELALLDVDDLPGGRGRDHEVGLAAQERRDLQHVGDRGRRVDLRHLVDVGEDRDAVALAHRGEDLEALLHARAPVGAEARAVGLVVARLEDEGDAELGRDRLDPRRHLVGVGGALDHAGAGDQEEPVAAREGAPEALGREQARAHDRRAASPARAAPPARARRLSRLARTKSRNSGCGASGLDLNSGWYCTATNHGWSGSSAISTNFPSGVLPETTRPWSSTVFR